ncbi:MAG TPA: SDR family oxidoreductase [Candidatus Paceibacterota bacterium]|nr:SDR family oxidoreductase [Candidatus Paceibacterota bacterium]
MLQGKTILITGSSSPEGIGAETARLACEYGAKVILHGLSHTDSLQTLAKELNAKYIICDVSDSQAVTNTVRAVLGNDGKVDALINCAGIAKRKLFLETNDEDWIEHYKINVLGIVHFCQAVIPYMQKQKHGRIVNVASIRGFGNTSGRPVYSASKAAVINLTATLAKDFAPDILVNAVAPGFVQTEMSKLWDDVVWKQVNTSLLGRVGKPSEIGEMLLFLSSDKASFITGQTMIVDGGYSISQK